MPSAGFPLDPLADNSVTIESNPALPTFTISQLFLLACGSGRFSLLTGLEDAILLRDS